MPMPIPAIAPVSASSRCWPGKPSSPERGGLDGLGRADLAILRQHAPADGVGDDQGDRQDGKDAEDTEEGRRQLIPAVVGGLYFVPVVSPSTCWFGKRALTLLA